MSVGSFLIDAKDDYFAQLAACGEGGDSSNDEQWPKLHTATFGAVGLSRPTSRQLAKFAEYFPSEGMRKWFCGLPLRSQEVAWLASLLAPRAGPDFIVDLSQTIGRIHVSDALQDLRLQCFTARSIMFLVRSRRFLSGRERLAMHGLSQRSMTQHAPDSMLGDLAGNSFSAPCFMVAMLAGCRP